LQIIAQFVLTVVLGCFSDVSQKFGYRQSEVNSWPTWSFSHSLCSSPVQQAEPFAVP